MKVTEEQLEHQLGKSSLIHRRDVGDFVHIALKEDLEEDTLEALALAFKPEDFFDPLCEHCIPFLDGAMILHGADDTVGIRFLTEDSMLVEVVMLNGGGRVRGMEARS